jgi:hypothetical protein
VRSAKEWETLIDFLAAAGGLQRRAQGYGNLNRQWASAPSHTAFLLARKR